MLQDPGNPSTRSILLRRLSSNPTTPPANSRKGSMRAIKGNVGGTSPHSIQRRRTTASHTGRALHSGAPENFYQRRRHHESGYAFNEPLRPSSWHPNSRSFDTTSGYCPTSEPTMRSTIAGFQNLAVTTSIGAAGEESPLRNPLPVGPNYAVNPPPTNMLHPAGGFHDGQLSNINPPIVYVPQPVYAWPSQYQGYFSDMPPSYNPPLYPSAEMQQPNWCPPSHFTANPVPMLAPDYFSTQPSSETPDSLKRGGESQLPRKRSKELIGMGLYNNPDDDLWSELDHDTGSFLCHLANPHRESTGKGLKLEETWEPPKAQDGAEDDDASSSDEAEEELPTMLTTMEQVPAASYPPYGDLSNQSFFFDSDDPYPSCVTFDQGLSSFQPKYPEPARENFLWC